MLNNLFNSETSIMDVNSLIICTLMSLICGLIIALTHKYTSKYTKGYLTTISLLPFLVQIVIILVNGNLGTGVAIMGAFSLVRFRSLPGNAKEILTVFFAMVIGLTIGTGYALFALIITILGSLCLIIYNKLDIFKVSGNRQILKIVIPEDLDYTGVFNDLLIKYCKDSTLQTVKMIDMGSMYELKYNIILKDVNKQKEFIDELRVRNGNLKIILSRELEEGDL